jgi:hypothetical protein
MTRYEWIKNMSQEQMESFLVDICLCQVPRNVITQKKAIKFKKSMRKFLCEEVDYNEYEERVVII